jgi:hypothetical protein
MVDGPIRRTNHTEPVPYFTMSTKARLRQGANRPPEGGRFVAKSTASLVQRPYHR